LIDGSLRTAGVRLNVVNEVSFATTVLSLVSAEFGVSVLPMNNHPSLPALDLIGRPVVAPVITRQISIFTRERRSLSPTAEQFAQYLRQYVARTQSNNHLPTDC